ncbi:MAG: dihydrofolate reductase family protein [Thermoleophilaceae bacterium]|nr:dihydrofolate reductase family protein [Thermoleophilaceae bacterium]
MTSADPPLIELTRLFPPPGDALSVDAQTAYAELEFASRAPSGRPCVIVNMVATADGQGRIGANTAALGGPADAALFATLRERVDCVMAGTGTVAAESYNAPARSLEVQRRRIAAGLQPRPLVATVTRAGELPVDAPMFSDPDLRVAVFSEAELVLDSVSAEILQTRTTDPAEMLRALRDEHGVRSVLLEGGPRINGLFFERELVDELFLTIAPTLIGSGDPFPIIAGALPGQQQLHLISALVGDEHLFLRYRVD